MMSDYAFGVHYILENTRIVLTSTISELKMEGDRQSPRVFIPCPASLLQDLIIVSPGDSSDVTFSLIPVMFNVGINEKQEIQDKLNRPTPLMNSINQYSLNRLYRWIVSNSPDKNVLVNGYLSM